MNFIVRTVNGAFRMPVLSVFALAILSISWVSAASAAENEFIGKFTFNWLSDPAKARCIKIDNKLMSMLASSRFHCRPPQSNTASGVTAQMCAKVDGTAEYMIFDAFADCENERTTQAASD
jgi:hypothetical protein